MDCGEGRCGGGEVGRWTLGAGDKRDKMGLGSVVTLFGEYTG